MTPTTKAALRGWLYMAVVATAFGLWQASVLAGIFMLLFLLFVEKLVRVVIVAVAAQNEAASDQGGFMADADKAFEVRSDELGKATISIDMGIDYGRRKNCFRLHSQYDTLFSDSEYEYRIDGTDVFVRLVHDYDRDLGSPETWDVRDGVVQEMDIRSRWLPSVVRRDDIEEELVGLKQQVEWQKLSSTHFNGVKYCLLASDMPRPNARRYFRQELERLKIGLDLATKKAAELGFEVDDKPAGRSLRVSSEDPRHRDSELNEFWGSLKTFSITDPEFISGSHLIAELKKLLGEGVREEPKA